MIEFIESILQGSPTDVQHFIESDYYANLAEFGLLSKSLNR